jgi:hypothetical protein
MSRDLRKVVILASVAIRANRRVELLTNSRIGMTIKLTFLNFRFRHASTDE